ncbi:MAG: hypothetical protein A2234_02110 [Elusimicrobia bacterium RIFOXYA2_FULL_58_8]|nr:MAG: hypothetical protein A2234_02110 [Elusimicrobia bacterium RIFOXYA2_FULL_58_8]
MIKLNIRKKNKPVQYAVGGTVAVIILGVWVSLPLINNTVMSSSVAAGNPFNSKVANISSLGGDVVVDGGAVGSPLSGEMINNPATSGEEILSTLFGSGAADEAQPADASYASASAEPAPASDAGGSYGSGADSGYGSGSSSRPGGKLAAVASLAGSSGGSMTAGGTHGKFFGSGNQKSEFAPAGGGDLKKMPSSAPDRKGSVSAMLGGAVAQSKLAAGAGDLGSARGGATTAFGGNARGGASADLKGAVEESAAVSGLEMGQAAGNLKKSNPGLNKKTVTMPKVTPPEKLKEPEDWKQVIIKMLIQASIGMVFGGGMGRAMGGF